MRALVCRACRCSTVVLCEQPSNASVKLGDVAPGVIVMLCAGCGVEVGTLGAGCDVPPRRLVHGLVEP
jgi:hypothetical protein